MKKILSIALICTISTQAHAGIWDTITGFFGGGEEVQTQTTPKIEEPKADASLLTTGLQLLPLLTQTLGVTDGQAKGGMGAILQASQALLSKTEYGKLLGAIPNAQGLLAAVPALTGNQKDGDMKSKLISGAMGAAGETGGALKQGAELVSQFKSLGLGADMIPKFGNVAGDYLKTTDQPETSNLLTGALSQLKGLSL